MPPRAPSLQGGSHPKVTQMHVAVPVDQDIPGLWGGQHTHTCIWCVSVVRITHAGMMFMQLGGHGSEHQHAHSHPYNTS
eukprot:786139-Pelagomonas_calceolata.AAC.6